MRVRDDEAGATDRDRRAGRFLDLAAHLLVQRLAAHGADGRPDRGRGQQRGREQPDHEADPAEPGRALGDRVVALLDREVAFQVLAHHDRAPEARAAAEDRLVVLVRGVGRQVAADQDVDRLVIDHRMLLALVVVHADRACAALPWCSAVCTLSSSCAERCGVMSNTTFFTVPVNANGFWCSYARSTTPPLSRPMSIPA